MQNCEPVIDELGFGNETQRGVALYSQFPVPYSSIPILRYSFRIRPAGRANLNAEL